MARAHASRLKCIFKSGSPSIIQTLILVEWTGPGWGHKPLFVCVQKDLVRHSEGGMACCCCCCSSVVQLCPTLSTPWTAACQASCHPLLSPSPTFNLSQHQGLLSHQIFFWKKRFRHLRNISICSLFYYPANLFPTLMGEYITTGLKSVTFYHHCVFAKARNHL